MKRLFPVLALMAMTCPALADAPDVPSIHYQKYTRALKPGIPDNLPVLQSLPEVVQYVHAYLTYTADAGPDYWQSVQETMKRRAGDCEDWAVLSRALVLANHLAEPEDIRLLLVQVRETGEIHTVLVVRGKVLNNRNTRLDDVQGRVFLSRYLPLVNATP